MPPSRDRPRLAALSTDLAAPRDLVGGVPGVELPERVTFGFADRVGSISFVPGDPPTRNLRLGVVWL